MNRSSITVLLLIEDNHGDVRRFARSPRAGSEHDIQVTHVGSIVTRRSPGGECDRIVLLDLDSRRLGLDALRRAPCSGTARAAGGCRTMDDDLLAIEALQHGARTTS